MLPNPKVMAAVEHLQYQATAADVATEAGLPIQIANRELANLASLTRGDLLVSQTGEIAYKFNPTFRQILLQRSLVARCLQVLQVVWRFVFYLIRISFGIVLVISILLVLAAISVAVVIIISSNSSKDNDGNNTSKSEPVFFDFNPFTIFYFGDFYDRPSTTPEPGQTQTVPTNQTTLKKDRGFLENVFAFLFGDGNPNYDLEYRRWHLIANVIRNNDGVVIGEQILPYLDEIDRYQEEGESYILPVLAKFNGYPTVTPDGELVYRFPDLQRVASRRPKQVVPPYLEEKLWRFNEAGDGANFLSASLGIFYFVASLVLGGLLQDPSVQKNLTGFLGFVNSIFVFLLAYAILYLLIPTVRYGVLQWINLGIKQRNELRRNRSLQLNQPKLQNKLAHAKTLAIELSAIDEEELAYSTETDLLTQEFAKFL